MELEKIIEEIENNLTGDSKKDVQYLLEQGEKYKDHKNSKEIRRACGRLLYHCVSKETKKSLDKIISDETLSYELVIKKARALQHEGKYDEALKLMEDLINKTKGMDWFKDDSVSEYHCFNEFFEEVLYREYTKPTKTIRNPGFFRLDTIYFQYGSLLIDAKRFQDAEKALITALRWNPANADIALERAETCKLQGNLEAFFNHSIEAFKYAFRPKSLARCFRNVGYYFSDKEMWQEATNCYTLSLQFDNNSDIAMSEILYIQEKTGKNAIRFVDLEFAKKTCEKYGFPLGPDKNVLDLAYSYGKHFIKEGDNEGAKYCLQIVYDLTNDGSIAKQIEELSTK